MCASTYVRKVPLDLNFTDVCVQKATFVAIVMLPSSSLVLASFCPVQALQMLARNMYRKQLHVTFIEMLPSSLFVLASFYPVHAYKCSQTTCNEQHACELHSLKENACEQHLFRAICSRATSSKYFVHELNSLRAKRFRTICLKSKLIANYE